MPSILDLLEHRQSVPVIKYNDFVSQHAVNLFLEPLRSAPCASVNDSEKIRTETTLDQDCVMKADVHVCTACVIVSLLTTCLNLNTPPLAQVSPFRCKIRESNAEVPMDSKLNKHVCQLIALRVQAWSTASWPFHNVKGDHHGRVRAHVPTKRLLSRSSSRILSLLKVLRKFTAWRQTIHNFSYCLLCLLCSCFAPCSCFAHCCHDPFIVRNASNLSTVPWFHSVCAFASRCSKSLTTVYSCFCFGFWIRIWTPRKASVQPSRPKPLRVHTKCLQTLGQIHHRLVTIILLWSVKSMVWRTPILRFDFVLRIVATFARFFSFLVLISSSRTCSNAKKISRIYVLSLLYCFQTTSPFLQHSMLSCSESSLQNSKCDSQSASPNLA